MPESIFTPSRLGLGAVQFGLDYGISNSKGRTAQGEVRRILALAAEAGIEVIDTAAVYGDSEAVLGEVLGPKHTFTIVTKTCQFGLPKITSTEAATLKRTFLTSLSRLCTQSVYGLLVHSADDLLVEGGEWLWQALEDLRSEGRVIKIGVSAYTTEQIEALMERYPLQFVQVPINAFDQRLIRRGILSRLKEDGVEIHARSVFLQGLLLMRPMDLPSFLGSVANHLARYQHVMTEKGLKPLQAALGFVSRLTEIDTIIVGACSRLQLAEILEASAIDNLELPDYRQFALDDPAVLNPSNWKITEYEKK
jgi:aryl-alcohol dehydrogenase-like predicted oxidoreductase